MQSAGQRAKRKSAAGAGGGAADKQQRELTKAQQAAKPVASKKQKRRASDVAAAPAAKKSRRSAPELPKTGGIGQATPVAPARSAYNLRARSSLPAAGTRLTDASLPTSGGLPSSVRPRNPNQKATWNELPVEVLKIICQHLDPTTILAARRVASAMREACSSAPLKLRFTLPMQSSPWVPAQLEAWERRVNGVAGLLGSGKMLASELQLRMEGAAMWKGDENMPAAQVQNAVQRLTPLLVSLRKLGTLTATPIRHLDVELPITLETVALLSLSLPDVTSLRLDSLIPPPHNHVMIFAESRSFTSIRKLDLSVTAWDQLQYLSPLTQLTELNVRYCMWNIPELSPLATLQNLTTFGIEVLDDRARFQLDFLGPLVRGVARLRHVRAAIILSRTVVSESGPASCDFLAGCGLETLDLDVRVPEDAARTAHMQFRNLHLAPPGCKVKITIRADALTRETSFESAATRCANLSIPRLGMAQPAPPEPRERWAALNMTDLGIHSADALQLLHLRGYHSLLSTLPDLSASRITRLQVSDARLTPADFAVLAGCTTLEHLFVRFTYQPDATSGASVSNGLATTAGTQPGSLAFAWDGFIKPRELHASLRLVAHGAHGMLTRSRKSLQEAGRRSTGSASVPPTPPPDCTGRAAPYVLQPLLQLRKLRSLELIEEPQPVMTPPTRLSAVGLSSAAAADTAAEETALRRRRGAAASTATAVTTAAASVSAPTPSGSQAQGLLPFSRSGLRHFLIQVSALEWMSAVSIQLRTEEADLPDCPCRTSCFAAGTKGKEPPRTIDSEAVRIMMGNDCYKIVLGSLVVESPTWYRPSTWPSLY